MHVLRMRAATDKEEPADPIKDVKETVLQQSIREYAMEHRSEIHRSEKPDPDRFRDLVPNNDDITLDEFFVSSLMSGSNFSGHSVHQANYRKFLELYGEFPGVFKLGGGHDSYGIAIRLSDMTDDMLDTLHAMDDYASMDDAEVSKIEQEAISDAWEDWARHDFLRMLEREFPDHEDAIDSLTDEDLLTLFEELRSRIGAEWVHETGNRSYIAVEPIAEACKVTDLPKSTPKEEPAKEEPEPTPAPESEPEA